MIQDRPSNEYQDFITKWNIRFPLDKWWRDKHGIAFGSEKHLSQSALHIRLEFEEDRLYKESRSRSEQQKKYVPGTGDYLVKRDSKMSQKEVVDLFENIDIHNIEEQEGGKIVIKGK